MNSWDVPDEPFDIRLYSGLLNKVLEDYSGHFEIANGVKLSQDETNLQFAHQGYVARFHQFYFDNENQIRRNALPVQDTYLFTLSIIEKALKGTYQNAE